MNRLFGLSAIFAMNVILCWLSPPTATAIHNADPVVLVFAIYGLSHIELMMLVTIWRLHLFTDRTNAETRRLQDQLGKRP